MIQKIRIHSMKGVFIKLLSHFRIAKHAHAMSTVKEAVIVMREQNNQTIHASQYVRNHGLIDKLDIVAYMCIY